MLRDVQPATLRLANDHEAQLHSGQFIDFDRLLAAARRQWRIVSVFGVLGLLLGVAYIVTAIPQYTASANLLIDQGSNRIVDELSTSGGALEDESAILSQVEILKSDQIAGKVVENLNLTGDPAFMNEQTSILRRARLALRAMVDVSSWFQSNDDEVLEAEEQRLKAVAILSNNLDVERVGRSYVLTVSYTSPDPAKAAQIAQAFAEAYLADQLDSKYEATRRASGWLQQRIDELRQRALETDLAVQKFRADKGLIAADGRLVSDQQLTELNSQLTLARADVTTTKAKLDRIESLLASGDTNAVVNDSLVSATITGLRGKYLEAAKRASEIGAKLGPDHLQVVRLRAEMADYQRLMFEELGRIAESYRSDYQVAQTREASVKASVEAATGVSAGANDAQVQLRELEREAETYRNLYQTFLQRYQEAVQQQSFPITEARVITQAQEPAAPSKPKKPIALALALIMGLAVGSGLGAFREFRDRFFRTADQVREELGLEFLGSVPTVKGVAIAPAKRADKAGNAGLPGSERNLLPLKSVSRHVLDHPMSSFAEALRSAKIAGDLTIENQRSKILGIVSALPGEGKSTISINMAQLLASYGAKVLLIDGDIRNPGLTRAVGRHAKVGLVETIIEDRQLSDVLLRDPDTGLDFLPTVLHHRVPHSSELLSSPTMWNLLSDASKVYDYIIVDLPPLGPVVDVRAFASRVDAFIFVVEWGRTARRLVRSMLDANPTVADKCLGVILNKVDMEKLKLYKDFGSDEYYSSRYQGYYRQGKG